MELRGSRVSAWPHRGWFLALAAALAGCRTVGLPEAPEPVPSPPDPAVVGAVPRDEPDRVSVEKPPEGTPADPILASPAARDTTFRRQVDEWTELWTDDYGQWFPVYLERMGAYGALVDEALAAEGLPPSLRYLPIVESGYSPRAVSRAAAVGMWQFMGGTARSLGMQVDPLVDERRDPVASTVAAARFLKQLHDQFGSWFLALAAYNGGPNRIVRLLAERAPLESPSDELYLRIRPDLPRETAEFVAKFFAAVRVAESADRYGVAPEAPQAPLRWDEVTVPDATSLDVVADAAGVSEDEVVALNPQIVRKVTPRGRATTVRIPAGAAPEFERAYALIPPDRRITVEEHVVARGETLWGIARLYGVKLGELEAANPDVDPRRLRPGHRLMVPRMPGSRGAAASRVASAGESSGARVHVVQSGDTLWDLARRYHVGVDDLLRWNGLADGAILQPGQRLRLGGA